MGCTLAYILLKLTDTVSSPATTLVTYGNYVCYVLERCPIKGPTCGRGNRCPNVHNLQRANRVKTLHFKPSGLRYVNKGLVFTTGIKGILAYSLAQGEDDGGVRDNIKTAAALFINTGEKFHRVEGNPSHPVSIKARAAEFMDGLGARCQERRCTPKNKKREKIFFPMKSLLSATSVWLCGNRADITGSRGFATTEDPPY